MTWMRLELTSYFVTQNSFFRSRAARASETTVRRAGSANRVEKTICFQPLPSLRVTAMPLRLP